MQLGNQTYVCPLCSIPVKAEQLDHTDLKKYCKIAKEGHKKNRNIGEKSKWVRTQKKVNTMLGTSMTKKFSLAEASLHNKY